MAGRLRGLIRRYGVKRRARAVLHAPGRGARALRARAVTRAGAWAAQAPPERLARLRPVLGTLRRLAPRRRFLAQAEALVIARSAGWAAAAAPVLALEGARLRGPAARALLAAPKPYPRPTLATPAARAAHLPAGTGRRIVVYTTGLGARPQLAPLAGVPEGVRFLCFSDHAITVPGWEIVAPVAGADPALYRICPHRVLEGVAPEAEWSLYLAPDRPCVGNLHTLIGRWLSGRDFALWRDAHCGDWHDLAERLLITGAAPAGAVLAQARACAAAELPHDRGVCDTGVIWRRHGTPELRALMEEWWALMGAAEEGAQDGAKGGAPVVAEGVAALALCRLLHGAPQAAPAILPLALGPAEDSLFAARYRRRPVAARAPARRPARIPVSFLYPAHRRDALSCVLRGQQLSEIVAAELGDVFDVSYVSDASALRDRVVIATSLALAQHGPAALRELRARNIALVGEWLDGLVRPEKAAILDAHMTFSLRQAIDMNRLYPGTPAFPVTHHVNTRIAPSTAPQARLRTGYFGDLRNTTLPESLQGAVSLVDTKSAGENWFEMLRDYNCHWILRQRRPGFGWKPFLKGFVAARVGAVVLVTRDDENAAHYLGDDYPFYAESLDAADLEMAWARMAGAFGGPDWRMAQDIMRQVAVRSSDAQVAAEFRAMIDEILA